MSDSFQLDMFGDPINDDSNEPIPINGGKEDGNIREQANDVDSVGAGVPRSLEEISSDISPESSSIGDTSGNYKTGGKQGEGRDLQPRKKRSASARSAGEDTAPLHPAHPGGESAGRTVLDYRLSAADNIEAGGKVAKFEANLAAIRLLKELEEENRSATAAEQSVLVKYTGWGGISEAFNPNANIEQNSWTARNNLLKEFLTPKEYRQAAASTLTAHYTPPEIISSIWDAVKRMGYKGGPTLEPASGTGLFFGGRPEDLPVKMYGIEIDSISGRIAKQLYPSADIQISGYENYKMPENRFNLAISNVPFGNHRLYESRETKTPDVDNGHLIHNYYFLKSLHGVKEGGLVAFITSKGTLDNENTDVRKKIAQKADFVGAIRLPNSAFKQIADTDVVADIVFLQKRPPSVPMSDLTKLFINTSPISIVNSQGIAEEMEINNYFVEHPEMIMGTQDLTSSQYGGNEYTVNLDRDELPHRLRDAVERLPVGIVQIKSIDNNTEKIDHALAVTFTDRDHFALPVGSFAIGSDSKVYQKESQDFDGGVFKLHPDYENNKESSDAVDRISGMIKIRDCTRTIFYNHYNKVDLQDLSITQKDAENLLIRELNDYYEMFTSKYGVLNSPKNYKAFMEDPDSSLLIALEHKDKETGKYYKSDIFTGVNFAVNEIPDRVESTLDAMSLSLTQYGSLDIGYMASLTGMDKADLVTELVRSNHAYLDHESFGRGVEAYIPTDEYLSGNIRRKIQAVEKLIETAPQFARNLEDLKTVMPRDLGPEEIRVRINSPIVGQKHVEDFIAEAWKDSSSVKSEFIPRTGEWKIDIKYSHYSKANDVDTKILGYYGTVKGDGDLNVGVRIRGQDILDKVMNGKPIKVDVKKEESGFDGKTISVLDYKATDMATAIAQNKADAITDAFSKWIWRDTERTNDIVKRYNEIFNSTVPRKFTHPERMKNPDAQVYLHGCAFHSPLRPHQADAIWRVIQQKNTMLAHAVGAGKTLEMAGAAMEMRRLGLRNKPMIVCPNHMIKQWAKEVREAYPAAKLLIADDKNWSAENRKAFINRVATGDWDAVIIRSTSFRYIAMSPERQLEFFQQKKDEYADYLDGLSKENRWTRKNVERKIAGYDAKIQKLADMPRDSDAIHFEMLGVDHLFIDEADMFKNLEYNTQLVGVKGLGTPTGSERAFDMYMKVQHVQQGGGGVTFATGTPISNTLVEAYTMQRYLQPEELEINGLTAFDSWVRQFAEAVTTMELNNTGTDFKSSTRLSKIVNVPELMASIKQTWDIKSANDLERMGILVPGKNLPYKKITNVVAPSTPLLKSYLKHLDRREACLSGVNEKGADNILKIIGDGRKAAIDLRLINPHLPDDPNSKLNLAVKIIHDTYKKYENERYAVAVFLDRACSYDKGGALMFDAVEDIKSKLITMGVKPEEIEDAGDKRYTEGNNKYDKRQEMFSKVNEGTVRVVIGSTETMGAGTNFQKNLKAIVHVDVPWRPRDIEQQNGRGYRSGNQTGEVEIYNLTTKGSLDAGLYAVLETKQKLISQVMGGAADIRELEEEYYSSVKELSIENEFLKEAITLRQDIKKLQNQEYAHNTGVAQAIRSIQNYDTALNGAAKSYEAAKKDIEKRVDEASVKADNFSIVLYGEIYTKRKDAGALIIAEAKALYDEVKMPGNPERIEKTIGAYAGYELVLRAEKYHFINSIATLNLKGTSNSYHADIRDDADSVGLCTSLHNVVFKTMDVTLESAKSRLESVENSHANDLKIIDAPFEKAAELNRATERLAEVEQILNEQRANNKDQPVEQRNYFAWEDLDKIAPQEVHRNAISFCEQEGYFFQHLIIEPESKPEPEIKSGANVAEFLLREHSVVLGKATVEFLDTKFADNDLSPQTAYELLNTAVLDFKNDFSNCGHTWNMDTVDNYAEYVSGASPRSGNNNYVVKFDEQSKNFDAYLVKNSELRKLGGGTDFEDIKKRVENHAINAYIGKKIIETVNLSIEKPPELACAVPQTRGRVDLTD